MKPRRHLFFQLFALTCLFSRMAVMATASTCKTLLQADAILAFQAQKLPLGVSRQGIALNNRELPDDRDDDIVLEMDEIKEISPGETVDLGGLGPCIGIIIYNPISKRAIAAHAGAFGATLVRKAICKSRTLGTPSELEIYSAGGNDESNEDSSLSASMAHFRAESLKEIIAGGFDMKNTFTSWGKKSNRAAILILHTGSGMVSLNYE